VKQKPAPSAEIKNIWSRTYT